MTNIRCLPNAARRTTPSVHPRSILAILVACLSPLLMAANSEQINTAKGWQDSPFVSLDGQRLIFAYSRFNFTPIFRNTPCPPVLVGPERPGHHGNDSDPFMDTDNYVVARNPDGSWRGGVIVNFPFNTDTSDCCAMEYLDRGENKLLYLKAEPGVSTSGVFYEATLRDGAWSEPRVIRGDELHDADAIDDNPHITVLPNGNAVLLFASTRNAPSGEKDLYYSTRPAGGEAWSKPKNMGPHINTDDAEDQPWLSPDGGTLFFNRGNQIFESRWTGTGWLPAWHVPLGDLAIIGEASLTADLLEIYFLWVDNTAPLWSTKIMRSQRRADGGWGTPEPVD